MVDKTRLNMENIRINSETGCWEWIGPRHPQGYGETPWNEFAHRAMWRIINGAIPHGMCICHHCDNPPCVNPAHLFMGTRGDNNRDRTQKGRSTRLFGTNNGRGKLTDGQIQEIKERYTIPSDAPKLAAEYGVARTTIINIVRGRRRQVLNAA